MTRSTASRDDLAFMNKGLLDRTLSAVAKHGDDVRVLVEALRRLRQIELRPLAA